MQYSRMFVCARPSDPKMPYETVSEMGNGSIAIYVWKLISISIEVVICYCLVCAKNDRFNVTRVLCLKQIDQ